ncbi:beta-ketoacyl-ACP synthase III [Yunchengibacter salinarum]|uniref:beta-ketoacyl-ACP synthase III n=1 Tax=Yunchengibacter salinarum TaxID=3133399 RepID=UPI0035B66BAC
MSDVAITGTGLFVPENVLTNEAMVAAFNAYVDRYNAENSAAIEAGDLPAKQYSSTEFIEKASGIRKRHMISTEGLEDPERMRQVLPEDVHGKADGAPSLQAGMALKAARQALEAAGLEGRDINKIILSAAVVQRSFPAVGIEVQQHLGAGGAAEDMLMGCSSATFGIINGYAAIKAGLVDRVLMVNPEIFTTMVNFTDRDSHFIFGDIASAVVLERADLARDKPHWLIRDVKEWTGMSDNIRSNFGPMTRFEKDGLSRADNFFVQEGRKVFKELLPLVTDFITDQMARNQMTVADLKRMWLHQANINMNKYAAKKLLGREPTEDDAPTVLDKYGNIAGAGSVAAFHERGDGFATGERGYLCSFGAGYSIAGILVERAGP